ncbi:hypothetical protein ENVG_00066 [Emiliania huxleyi virus 84]|nr:hypothetical protein ENVG_00066 [Emiliania huxleyi virus 84]AEP15120.1 hypothetical protein EOVG_00183 [Emiliania huxleyi virus 88]
MFFMLLQFVGSYAMRSVYIDLGVNWCNTIRMFKEFDNRSSFDVYGFEASPLIHPFADKYFKWLNGETNEEPETCLPRSGSSKHLSEYAKYYNCPTKPLDHMRSCMWNKLSNALNSLTNDPRFNDTELIESRLWKTTSYNNNYDRYTFIPAAVSTSTGWLHLSGDARQLIRGGAIPPNGIGSFVVRSIDFVTWFKKSFSKNDYIILKMDIEGAEHSIIYEMEKQGLLSYVNVISMECHGKKSSCNALVNLMYPYMPALKIMTEGIAHNGIDKYTIKETNERAKRVADVCSHVDLTKFSISHIH